VHKSADAVTAPVTPDELVSFGVVATVDSRAGSHRRLPALNSSDGGRDVNVG
jgi:hypothetical protein